MRVLIDSTRRVSIRKRKKRLGEGDGGRAAGVWRSRCYVCRDAARCSTAWRGFDRIGFVRFASPLLRFDRFSSMKSQNRTARR